MILGLILWQALTHHRHIAFFAIACGWWLPLHFDSLLRGWASASGARPTRSCATAGFRRTARHFRLRSRRRCRRASPSCSSLAICICAGQLAVGSATLKVERERLSGLPRSTSSPDRKLTGKMVCTFNWAQYALAAFGPQDPASREFWCRSTAAAARAIRRRCSTRTSIS